MNTYIMYIILVKWYYSYGYKMFDVTYIKIVILVVICNKWMLSYHEIFFYI